MQEFGDEIKRWLPSKDAIAETMQPKLEPLQRTITESLPPVRDAVAAAVYGDHAFEDLGRMCEPEAPLARGAQRLLAAGSRYDWLANSREIRQRLRVGRVPPAFSLASRTTASLPAETRTSDSLLLNTQALSYM